MRLHISSGPPVCVQTHLCAPDIIRWRQQWSVRIVLESSFWTAEPENRRLLPLRTLRLVYHSVSVVPAERKIAVEICDGWFEASGRGLSVSGKRVWALLLILKRSHWKKLLSSGHVFDINPGTPHTSGILTGFASLWYYPDSSLKHIPCQILHVVSESKLEPVSDRPAHFRLFMPLRAVASIREVELYLRPSLRALMHLWWWKHWW